MLFIIKKKETVLSSLHIWLDIIRITDMQISYYDCNLKGIQLPMEFIKRFY